MQELRPGIELDRDARARTWLHIFAEKLDVRRFHGGTGMLASAERILMLLPLNDRVALIDAPPKPKHKLALVVGASRYDDAKRMLPRGSPMPRTADVDMMMASAARATSATEKAARTKR